MESTLGLIKALIAAGEVVISDHGYDELAADGLTVDEVLRGVSEAQEIEDYPDYQKGRCVLVLQSDHAGGPIHAVWGIRRGTTTPAVLVTAYRPDPDRWQSPTTRRKS
ncbi:MAG: DUF4258 domain-containing protein [Planctomycetia bacterium]|nr:DUF4258 domain-containing protein [Planctomycetia bacterium]MCC7315577.1 DUF4258 domain-containing protein [Planctomycetota bacterium]OQZ05865.1 MAG: hypothetical protein B6D36_07905 [Planctomycetes bacterium UTPLA1]